MSLNTWNEEENGFSYNSNSTDVFITRLGSSLCSRDFSERKRWVCPLFY